MSILNFTDRATVSEKRRTADGYLAVRARSCRVGVYQYTGREVDPTNAYGLRDQALVNVLRDDAAVFDARAVRSFIGKPITNDHPSDAVTAANWKQHACGTVMGAIRDGDHLTFDLLLTDAKTIADVDAGKVELSNGYGAELQHGDFTAADGTKCAFRQTGIAGNHCAIVARGRAGATCRIGDAAPGTSFLRDAAGQPVTLQDRDTGRLTTLNADLIAAIEAEAAKLGMPVADYTTEVLRFTSATAALTLGTDPAQSGQENN